MHDTGFADDAYEALPRAALAYDKDKAKRKMSATPPMVAAGGTIYSTAADLVAIADAVYAGGQLSAKARTELLTVQHAPEEYALGGRVRDIAPAPQSARWPGTPVSWAASRPCWCTRRRMAPRWFC
jgi:D-alanyl-D-alanine carboxypeptidase